MPSKLRIQAGASALTLLRGRGLTPVAPHVIIGAAAGAERLILSHVDRFLFGDRITGRRTPL